MSLSISVGQELWLLYKKLREYFTVLQLYKLEHLVSNDRIPVVSEHNLGPRCLMLVAF
jgi:hypothetical protein